jgi:Leucine-rich repeat (LRR) protein
LGQNQITSINLATLSGLTGLKKLDFDNNKISSIELNSFASLSQLQYLDLSVNLLTGVNNLKV